MNAQLSPGDLAEAHAHLEGLSNCTQCHTLGKKVSNSKCLDCHSEIQSLLDIDKGYHASSDIVSQDCFNCHSDHHGRRFQMIRFDKDAFDHNLTGYLLEGQHDVIDCKECHAPDNINDLELKKRENTFLGLNKECLSCHEDFHQQTLSSDCISCHDFSAFRPTVGFDHDDAKFRLKGKHISTECIECHQTTERNGVEFQQFNDLEFNQCSDCHNDPHLNHFNSKCSDCHNEDSFTNLRSIQKFNHNTTRFSLLGAHKSVNCFDCHEVDHNPRTIFQDNLNIAESDCIQCHEDVHKNKFGNECAKCHTEESFFILKDMSLFDHGVTDYPLEGQHVEVDCKKCHIERYTEDIDFSSCYNCHEDYHRGEFVKDNISPDCKECHSLEEGFSYTLFTMERHEQTDFPLEGAHVATPCFTCHVSEDRWTFKNIGSTCVDCHEDIHLNYIDSTYYPEQRCSHCHRSDTWANISFDHTLTDWELEGKHVEVDCRSCHFESVEKSQHITQNFNNLTNDCVNCHENIHDQQFEVNGITDCKRCHDSQSWSPRNFDHSQTAFVLEGKHAEIECSACHESVLVNGQTIVNYKIESFECIDCHQ